MRFNDFSATGAGYGHAGHTQHTRQGGPAFTTRLRRAWQALAVAAVLLPAAAQVQANVGVFASALTNHLDDVVGTITSVSGGSLGTVTGHRLCTAPPSPCIATPTLAELQAYSTVLVYSNYSYSDPVALGNALADYVDAGGTVVLATFAFYTDTSYGVSGRLVSGNYMPLSAASGQMQFTQQRLVADLPNHPLLQSVATFSGGLASYRNTVTLASGATQVAHWNDSNNTPLIAVKGNVVALNFYPPSSNIATELWDASTDGGRIMVNALAWTMAITHLNLPAGQATVAYAPTTLTAAGGTAPVSWSATGLPDGMALSPAGVLSGTPTAAGTYTIEVGLQDSTTTPLRKTQTLTLEVTPAPAPIAITTTTLQPGMVGASYTAPVAATGGLAPLEWTVTGLPAGLAMDSKTGEITGTPTEAGSFNITVTATDKSTPTALTANQALTLVVAPAPIDLTVLTPAALPPATAGQAYSAAIAVQGGEAPYRFSVTAGTLPAGLALDGATGAITGTPTLAGDASFSITVDDNTVPKAASTSAKRAKGAKAAVVSVTQAFSLSVAPAAVAATPTPVPTLHHAALALLSLMAAAFGGLALRWKKTV